uniref:Uncharacterized protein n=1 Tax=Craspedostauros australis TaxID=1486917 RepID=A0A7R9ZPH0_9STRA|mmetsp:Transcript_24071/g.67155  ORF Transcript_24071/g.67155 Transcript_24071/m.67155 type:complete len:292 (+) Transcript_24071:150-1025(+)|eukprot:CAMPEP_0198115518 /NCGR_PEP_ID=MMETSP1442-20131203/6593_1 /TAXON_ID= /ORGANISM="Craspedostauros australis, Strain CCMP3328" /LENGTH=291 /DNA_ID=CAMNT_0043773039 /DNA_START=169 /DNA_END=1044 /DNA_ORIENTATION=+
MNFSCILAALLFFIGNLVIIIYYAIEYNREHYDYDEWKTLDPNYVKEEWQWRVDNRAPHMAAGILTTMGWFFFAFPMLQLTWVLSGQGQRMVGLHVMLAVLILAGCFTEFISRFMHFGSNLATEKLVNDFNLESWRSNNDELGWRTLELVHIVTQGMVWFVDAFEWLALFFIMLFVHISARSSQQGFALGGCWSYMALFISLFSLLDFVAEVLRLDGFRTFGQIAFWYAAVNRLVFLPVWLVLLARSLPVVSSEKSLMEAMANQANGGAQPPQPQQQQEQEGAGGENFTIG